MQRLLQSKRYFAYNEIEKSQSNTPKRTITKAPFVFCLDNNRTYYLFVREGLELLLQENLTMY